MPKIREMQGVREYAEGFPVELWRDATTGRLTIMAFNEGKCNSVDIDLEDLLHWLRDGEEQRALDAVRKSFAIEPT